MNHSIISLPILFLIFLLSALGNAETKEIRQVNVRFACLKFVKDQRQLKLSNETLIRLHLRHPSDEYTLEVKNNNLVLFLPTKNEKVIPIGNCNIPQQYSSGIVLLLPEGSTYHPLFLPTSRTPKGGVYIMNYSNEELGINLGGEKVKINHQQGFTYAPKTNGLQKLEVEMFEHQNSKTWRKVYSSKWSLVPNRREILVLTKHKLTNRILSQGITQYGAQ